MPRCLRHNKNYGQNGFTLIEVVVTLSIMVMIVVVGLPSYKSYEVKKTLQFQADMIASQVLEIQNAVLNGRSYGGRDPALGYGVYFSPSAPHEFIVYADSDHNGHFTDNGSEMIARRPLDEDIFIMATQDLVHTWPLPAPLDIYFQPPRADVFLNQQRSPGKGAVLVRHRSSNTGKKIVTDVLGGQVSVESW